MQSFYRQARQLIATERHAELPSLPLERPTHFNWYADVFEAINLADHPDALAVLWTDGETERRFTYRDLADRTDRILGYLRAHGIAEGAVIYSQIPLVPAIYDAHLVAIKGGYRLIPAATVLSTEDIAYRFRTVLPSVVIADPTTAPHIEDALAQVDAVVPIRILVGGTRDGWLSEEDLLAQPLTPQSPVDSLPDDPLFLFFTSGTTGMPKVVVHTHLSYPLGHLTTASWIGLRHGDVHYNISQPGWAKYAWSSFFAPLSMGATVLAYNPPGRFAAEDQFALMVTHGVTTFCAPPTALRLLVQTDMTRHALRIRQCVAAGEPLNPEVIELWRQGTGLGIRDGYGQTESTCLVANLPGDTVKPGSMGRPTFLYDVVIADDDGHELPVHEEGNICVRTGTGRPTGIFHHYLGDSERMAAVFRHGLYYTGDKAYRDEDGYIWFVGRDDDVIKASDYRIGPFEVESILLEHDAVLESAVVGSPHPVRGHEVKAFLILAEGHVPSEALSAELFGYARRRLAPYKVPRIIEFVTELPKTVSGKIRRVELRGAEADRRARNLTGEHEYFRERS